VQELGMKLQEFAAAVGVHPTSLSALENGARPSKQTVEKIAAFLGRPVRELDPDAWAFDRQAPRRVNAVTRSAQHAALVARARDERS
jgi:transcriptional regulator with XRE-family HTH domain